MHIYPYMEMSFLQMRMYLPVSLTSLVIVTVCHLPPPLLLFDDVPMMSTYVCVFWTLVFLPV